MLPDPHLGSVLLALLGVVVMLAGLRATLSDLDVGWHALRPRRARRDQDGEGERPT
mgnify:CR=1 FL=1